MKPNKRLMPSFFLLLLTIILPALSWAWQGKVVGISDGDTISAMHEGKAEKIRLYGLDCPESHQDFGQRAKQFTSEMVFGKVIDVTEKDRDRYGRTVGLVTIAGKSLNEELVKAGMAWVYSQYCKESFCTQWKQHEEQARQNKVGLWSVPNPTPPWEFRHPSKKGNSQTETKNEGNQGSPTVQGSVTYHGNTSSMIFHRPGCKNYECKHCTAVFGTREEAVRAGYKPCGICKP